MGKEKWATGNTFTAKVVKKKNSLFQINPQTPDPASRETSQHPGPGSPQEDTLCLSEKPEAEERAQRRGVQRHHAVPGHVSLRGHHLPVELGRQGDHLRHRRDHHQVRPATFTATPGPAPAPQSSSCGLGGPSCPGSVQGLLVGARRPPGPSSSCTARWPCPPGVVPPHLVAVDGAEEPAQWPLHAD